MARKGENIFKRKDGRWEARYVKGYELSGKIKYGFCYGKSYREAKEKVALAKAAFLLNNQPKPATSNRHRFAFFCDEWLQFQRSRIKESTYVKYETTLNRHIKPKLGGCFPLALTTQIIESFKQELLFEEELSAKTVKDILMVLHAILKNTAKQFSGTFPTVEIEYPKEQKKEMRVLTLEEQRHFIAYLQEDMDDCKFGVLLALLTGVRIGELCALRWENVSVESKTIHISATMQRLKDTTGKSEKKTRVMIGDPKSETSIRTIPLSDGAAELCKRMHLHSPTAFLLTGTAQYMEPRALQYRMAKYTRECGLEGVHFHTLRHTFATRCVEVGFELKSLSEVLGHANTSITLERYIHSSLALKRDNMNKLATIGM